MLTLEIEQQPEWIKLIEQGEEIVVLQHNQPVAKIIPFASQVKRKLGTATGLFAISDDFNEPLTDFDGYQ
ncbi:MAG: hypothetical protein PHH59_10245 [Methylovulum sp.]|uniref:type II toxin-antitoxin system Phd/YefM family antitoxin n=1 Tax=Methylovulum sp. TaxID=1916980 RepID=UPI00262A6CA9|nr:hypothetical protein [Methylovulum sp.]MDD2724386.1 hypothetical protein [Methylovulum sp.]MDD5124214.1 hypothetical protein [Methylovulum sp.]